MAEFVQEILTIFGALVTFTIGILMIVLFHNLARERSTRPLASTVSKEDFFSGFDLVSSDVDYFSRGLFAKKFQLEFRKIGASKPVLAYCEGEIKNFTKLSRLVDISETEGFFLGKFSGGSGAILAKLSKGDMKVKLGGSEAGSVNFLDNSISNAAGKKIGGFEKSGLKITGADVLGLPLFARRQNFSVSQKVTIAERAACTITFRKWPDEEEPLFQKAERRLGKEEMALIFSLAAMEWAMSLSIRE
ncbi:MAG TPA: hypothetical protein VJH23_01025 [archaeon]|nr:hypothetical protein [archaeon]